MVYIIRSLLELSAIIALIIGFMNEDKVIAWEERAAAWFRNIRKGASTCQKD